MMPLQPPQRPPMPPIGAPPVNPAARAAAAIGLVLGALLALPLAILVGIALWRPAWSLADALSNAIDRGADLVGSGLLLIIGAALVGWIWRLFAGAALASNRARQAKIVKLQNGQPVLIGDLPAIARASLRDTMGAFYGVEMQKAKREHPELRNYVNSPRIAMPVAAPVEQAALPPADVPSFAALLDQGAIGADADGRRQPLILGYGHEGAITGDWRSLYSCGLGGLQGSGKTWGAAFLLAQSALNGARLVICDPHSSDDESLAARVAPLAPAFLCDIADDDKSILAALKLADDVLQRRKRGDKDRTPVIVAIDEWLALRRGPLAELLPLLVEDFSTEGRKLNCHVMLLAQRWDKSTVGDFRNTLASSYVYRIRPDEARMMTGLRAAALPADTLQLAPGQAYLLDTSGQLQRVTIPMMRAEDMTKIGATLAGGAPSTEHPAPLPMGFRSSRPEAAMEAAMEGATDRAPSKASQRATTHTPEAARVLALILAGKSVSDVVKELWGISGGREYKERCNQIMAIVREALAAVEP